jgi:hypothetical protein
MTRILSSKSLLEASFAGSGFVQSDSKQCDVRQDSEVARSLTNNAKLVMGSA